MNARQKIWPAKVLMLAMLFIQFMAPAQNEVPLALEDAISKAQEKNASLQISKQDYAIAKAYYESSSAVLLPSIRVSNTSTFTDNPLNAFGFKLLQREVTPADFNPDLLNDPGDVENFNTRIEIMQPIINVDGWKERKTANLHAKAADLQSERNAEYIELEVTKAYMQLQLAFRSVGVLEKALETAKENRSLAENSLNQGLIQNADYLHVEVRLSEVENQLQQSRSNVKNVSEYLAFLMGENDGTTYVPSSELSLVQTEVDPTMGLNQNRKDIQAQQYAVEAQEQMLKASRSSFIPRANAMANYEWNDSEVFGFGATNYMIGLQLSWDIFGGYKNIGKIHREKAMLEKATLSKEKYLAESELELSKAKRNLADASNKVQLSKLAMEQSEEAHRIVTNRFEQGLEKTTELLFSETQYLEKELAYLQAVFEYNFNMAYVKFLTK